MEILPNDREAAEIIVLELVNESKFDKMINVSLIHYSRGTKNYISVQMSIIKAQAYHHRKDKHTYHLKELSDSIKHLVAVRIIEHYWEQHHESKFESWDIPPEARYLFGETRGIKEPETKTMEGPKSDIQNIPVTEIELRVLAKYTSLNNKAKAEITRRMMNHTWKVKILEPLNKFKDGSWAWKTLIGKMQEYILSANSSSRYYMNDNEKALTNLFVLHAYKHCFQELYQRDFTVWDIPPQCHYLFENSMFEETHTKTLKEPDNGWWGTIPTKHDDHIDALRFTEQIFKPYPSKIDKLKFKLKLEKENTMNHITKIETVVRINNTDASEYSDDDIFSLIAKTEKDIEKLEAIKEKPKKLTAKIKAMQASITELVKIVDTRD